MASSVTTLTEATQDSLQRWAYLHPMQSDDVDTPARRISHVIASSGRTLEQLAATVGCSHAALSQWQTGATNINNVKVGLLHAFCETTGSDVRWILTGQGPQLSRYVLRDEMQRIATALQAIERTAPQQIETIVRMVEAAAGKK
jgi:transcriptional regulator with XRE-family HTH domain